MNIIIFFFHTISISFASLIALIAGKEALISFICLLFVLANLFVTKQITLFGYNATCSDALMVGTVLSLNLLQEYYGKTIAKKTIWISFGIALMYTFLSQIHLIYIPNFFDTNHTHFTKLLSVMPRIMIASFATYLIAQTIEFHVYGFLRKKLNHTHFILRNYISTAFSQLIDTCLFSFLALYGVVENIGQIIIISYSIKLATLFIAAPFLSFSKKIVQAKKNYEQAL